MDWVVVLTSAGMMLDKRLKTQPVLRSLAWVAPGSPNPSDWNQLAMTQTLKGTVLMLLLWLLNFRQTQIKSLIVCMY